MRLYAMSLVERIGGMTVDEFLGRVSSAELTDWIAYDRDHYSEGWWQTDTLCRTIVAMVSGKWPKPGEFIPGYKPPSPSPQQIGQELQTAFWSL